MTSRFDKLATPISIELIMSIDRQLASARKACEEKGVRFTRTREQVFCLLAEHGAAIGAYELLDKLKCVDAAAKPATIYRALDFLCQQGFVHKIESINSFIFCDHCDHHSHPVQLLICDQCGHVDEISSANLDLAIRAMADASGFKIAHQIVEAHGYCQRCQ